MLEKKGLNSFIALFLLTFIFSELNRDRLLDLQVIRIAVRLIRFFAQLYDNIFEAYSIVFGYTLLNIINVFLIDYEL
jgi:hypothetical protein